MLKRKLITLTFLFFILIPFQSVCSESPQPIISKNAMVSVQESLAAKAGLEILKNEGNAVDAAVTIGFVLAVTLPRAGNIGGGGFMLFYDAHKKESIALDYRETAPLKAHEKMFLDNKGKIIPQKSTDSYLAVGVPGTVAGLIYALDNYGTISLEQAITPAINLAENGFTVTKELSDYLKKYAIDLKKHPATTTIFFKPNGKALEPGDILVQKDLATSLKDILKTHGKSFYKGDLAKKISDHIIAKGGIITTDDLATYKPVLRKPVTGTYRGYQIYSMPPPSSGGIHLIQMLNILENYNLENSGFHTPNSMHLMVSAMQKAYADRAHHLGDPDFVTNPVDWLISKEYAKKITKKITPKNAIRAIHIWPGKAPTQKESAQTTHYSIVDKMGNAVSNTYTLNGNFGMKAVVPGTGILLNNEMDDFTSKVGVKNQFGLVQSEKNKIEAGKRMLSSMTPTIITKDDKVFMVTGSPGGSRIITTVLQVINNVIDFNLNINQATQALRFHHQWLPDKIFYEPGFDQKTILRLKNYGYKVKQVEPYSCANSIVFNKDHYEGAADHRCPDGVAMGF